MNQHYSFFSTPGSGLDKRQCTLQVCFSPEDTHAGIAVIFKESGKRIGEDEKESYHKGVNVYWQKNAWADTDVSVEWVKNTLRNAVDIGCADSEFVLFCDNLNAQANPQVQEAVRSLDGIVWYGVPNVTHIWQPVDSGFGQMLKTAVKRMQDEWLGI